MKKKLLLGLSFNQIFHPALLLEPALLSFLKKIPILLDLLVYYVLTLVFLINVLHVYQFLATFSIQHALIRNNMFIKYWTFFLLARLFRTYSLTDKKHNCSYFPKKWNNVFKIYFKHYFHNLSTRNFAYFLKNYFFVP